MKKYFFLAITMLVSSAMATCDHPYYPVQTGWTWEYLNIFTGKTYSQTQSDVSPTGFTQVISQGKNPLTIKWVCSDKGISSIESGGTGKTASGFNFKTSGGKGVLFPKTMKVGSSWNYVQNITGKIAAGGELKGTSTMSSRVMAEEVVEVKAGKFRALRIESVTNTQIFATVQKKKIPMPNRSIKTTTWLVKGVGMVKSSIDGKITELVKLSK